MKKWNRVGVFLLLLCGAFGIVSGVSLDHISQGSLVDFKAVFYASKCVVHHSDPYKPGDFLRIYRADGGKFPSDPIQLKGFNRAVPICINLPTSLFLIAPITLLPFSIASVLWQALVAGLFMLAAFCTWDVARGYSSGISLFLICAVLVNSELFLGHGDLAGIVVSLAVIATWCFVKQRYQYVGVIALAISLVLKPHDAGILWLFFVLVGASYRKRALQSLLVVLILSISSALWVSHVAPHWIQEMHANIVTTSMPGDLNDPGPAGRSTGLIDSIISLQSVASVFRDDPNFYNPVTYAVCVPLLLLWSISTMRSRFSMNRLWLAVATLIPLTLLVTYHRPYDAKLLLLTIPACALLWAEGGAVGAVAAALTTAAIAFTGDISGDLWIMFRKHLHVSTATWPGEMRSAILFHPASLILLAMSIFYLRVYLRRKELYESSDNYTAVGVLDSSPGETDRDAQLVYEVSR